MSHPAEPGPNPAGDPPAALPDGLVGLPASDRCRAAHAERGYCTLAEIMALAAVGEGGTDRILARARMLVAIFNGGATAGAAIAEAARNGDDAAANAAAWAAVHGPVQAPAEPVLPQRAAQLLAQLEADPEGFVARATAPYPMIDETGRGWGFDARWVAGRLADGQQRLAAFIAGRRSEVAVLAGNGPSLRQVDPTTLGGADVYVSNYALRDPGWRAAARGVAVTNRLVAVQDPALFGLSDLWRFHPVWLGHELADSPRTVWLNAVGGPLFFAPSLGGRVAWHATVTYFWLQILFHAGYRRVAMIGFDHSYHQPPGVAEGTLLRQGGDDPNHFLPGYFRDRLWQAADTAHMGRTYTLARELYETAGRDLLNCTEGGALDLLPRRRLEDVLRDSGNR